MHKRIYSGNGFDLQNGFAIHGLFIVTELVNRELMAVLGVHRMHLTLPVPEFFVTGADHGGRLHISILYAICRANHNSVVPL